jgi:hypothetical protein
MDKEKNTGFLLFAMPVWTMAITGCAKPVPENIEDFGEKAKLSKTFNVTNADEWAAAVKAIDGGVYAERSTFSLQGGIIHGFDGGDKANTARRGASFINDNGNATYGDGSPIIRGSSTNGTLTGR